MNKSKLKGLICNKLVKLLGLDKWVVFKIREIISEEMREATLIGGVMFISIVLSVVSSSLFFGCSRDFKGKDDRVLISGVLERGGERLGARKLMLGKSEVETDDNGVFILDVSRNKLEFQKFLDLQYRDDTGILLYSKRIELSEVNSAYIKVNLSDARVVFKEEITEAFSESAGGEYTLTEKGLNMRINKELNDIWDRNMNGSFELRIIVGDIGKDKARFPFSFNVIDERLPGNIKDGILNAYAWVGVFIVSANDSSSRFVYENWGMGMPLKIKIPDEYQSQLAYLSKQGIGSIGMYKYDEKKGIWEDTGRDAEIILVKIDEDGDGQVEREDVYVEGFIDASGWYAFGTASEKTQICVNFEGLRETGGTANISILLDGGLHYDSKVFPLQGGKALLSTSLCGMYRCQEYHSECTDVGGGETICGTRCKSYADECLIPDIVRNVKLTSYWDDVGEKIEGRSFDNLSECVKMKLSDFSSSDKGIIEMKGKLNGLKILGGKEVRNHISGAVAYMSNGVAGRSDSDGNWRIYYYGEKTTENFNGIGMIVRYAIEKSRFQNEVKSPNPEAEAGDLKYYVWSKELTNLGEFFREGEGHFSFDLGDEFLMYYLINLSGALELSGEEKEIKVYISGMRAHIKYSEETTSEVQWRASVPLIQNVDMLKIVYIFLMKDGFISRGEAYVSVGNAMGESKAPSVWGQEINFIDNSFLVAYSSGEIFRGLPVFRTAFSKESSESRLSSKSLNTNQVNPSKPVPIEYCAEGVVQDENKKGIKGIRVQMTGGEAVWTDSMGKFKVKGKSLWIDQKNPPKFKLRFEYEVMGIKQVIETPEFLPNPNKSLCLWSPLELKGGEGFYKVVGRVVTKKGSGIPEVRIRTIYSGEFVTGHDGKFETVFPKGITKGEIKVIYGEQTKNSGKITYQNITTSIWISADSDLDLGDIVLPIDDFAPYVEVKQLLGNSLVEKTGPWEGILHTRIKMAVSNDYPEDKGGVDNYIISYPGELTLTGGILMNGSMTAEVEIPIKVRVKDSRVEPYGVSFKFVRGNGELDIEVEDGISKKVTRKKLLLKNNLTSVNRKPEILEIKLKGKDELGGEFILIPTIRDPDGDSYKVVWEVEEGRSVPQHTGYKVVQTKIFSPANNKFVLKRVGKEQLSVGVPKDLDTSLTYRFILKVKDEKGGEVSQFKDFIFLPPREPGKYLCIPEQEVCDGFDNDCDGKIDENVQKAYYKDKDEDGYGAGDPVMACSQPVGYVIQGGDCDDANPRITQLLWYKDSDGDAYTDGVSRIACSRPDGYRLADQIKTLSLRDCNDSNPVIYPGAYEICDGYDNDCNGLVDDTKERKIFDVTVYIDNDADGYGSDSYGGMSLQVVEGYMPSGFTNVAGDCNDNDPKQNPGTIWYVDKDGDGRYGTRFSGCYKPNYPRATYNNITLDDCDDNDNSSYPGAPLICNDNKDNDCDGRVEIWVYRDQDQDRYAPDSVSSCVNFVSSGYISATQLLGIGDCNDRDRRIKPGASLICGNSIDEDCDGKVESWFFQDSDGDSWTTSVSQCSNLMPSGFTSVSKPLDCNDSNPAINPATVWYKDADGDGRYPSGGSGVSCSNPYAPSNATYIAIPFGDCDDNNSSVYLGALLVCGDNIDNDCDGSIEKYAYTDVDGDRYAPNNISTCVDLVSFPGEITVGYELGTNDCNDNNASIHPGASLNCGNSIDEDCDGNVESWFFQDSDADSWTTSVSQCSNSMPSGFTSVSNPLDCNDSDVSINPGSTEVCDGIDNNCASGTDEVCIPSSPSSLTYTDVGFGKLILSWNDNSDNEQGFKVERSEDNFVTYVTVATVPANTPTYKDSVTSGLVIGGVFQYRVYAFNSTGVSPYSNVLTVDLPDPAKMIFAGSSHTCALLSDGKMRCWGNNSSGQLGKNDTSNSSIPVSVSGIEGVGLLRDVTVIGRGAEFSFALLVDGTVKCWGDNGFGKLGIGSEGGQLNAPSTSVVGITNAVQVDGGWHHACALLSDGTVKCWGYNSYGQLGNGTNTNSNTPVSVVGITNAVQVVSAGHHTCALLSDGTVKCWGRNLEGQLGDGTNIDKNTPVSVVGITNAVQIEARWFFSCALLSDGTVKCWGENNFGQLGDGTNTAKNTPVSVVGIINAVQIASGNGDTCALLSDGTVKCWGRNNFGQLGDGTNIDKNTPVSVVGINNAVQIALGDDHTCTLLSDGTVKCWGGNSNGQLGDGTNTNSNTPVSVVGMSATNPDMTTVKLVPGTRMRLKRPFRASTLVLGFDHTCALLPDGTVKCWGENTFGQLGDGTNTAKNTPVSVVGINNAVQIELGVYHTCALLPDGTVKCWGKNNYGQLGIGSEGGQLNAPSTSVVGITNAVQVDGGAHHTCALLSDGTVKCWGWNNYGQLGVGSWGGQLNAPSTSVVGITNAVQIEWGYNYTCALLSDGTVKCWGYNGWCQLGDGTCIDKNTPVSVLGITNAVQVDGGGHHTCALLSDGTVKCWGSNNNGQLGIGSTGGQLSAPSTSVVGITNAVQIALGDAHTCALLSDGTVKCWGNNGWGQLGDGTNGTAKNIPVSVVGIINAVRVDGGRSHTCALLSDGTVKCWGYNAYGQLGDGTNTDKNTPVYVSGIGVNSYAPPLFMNDFAHYGSYLLPSERNLKTDYRYGCSSVGLEYLANFVVVLIYMLYGWRYRKKVSLIKKQGKIKKEVH